MTLPKKAVALAAGFAAALVVTAGTNPTVSAEPASAAGAADARHRRGEHRLDRAVQRRRALREGVIEKMELDIGMPVASGQS